MGTAKVFRVAWGALSVVIVESLVFGLSAMPGLFTWHLLLNTFGGFIGGFFEAALIGIAFVPSYLVFCIALMVFTAGAARIMRWRSVPGTYKLADLDWGVIRWAQYNAAIHLVRLFAGGVLRATPLWTWFIRMNGARLGRHVHINTLSIYDHNLLEFGEDVVIGSDVKITAHLGQHGTLIVSRVRLGDRVTIGTNSIVFCGATIGDRTAVGAMSLVLRDAVLEPNSLYAGVPARRVSREEDEARSRVGLTVADPPMM